MPILSRTTADKINQIANKNRQFQTELETAVSELGRLQKATITGDTDTETLISAQNRVNVLTQTIEAFNRQLAELEAALIVQKASDRKKEIFSKIKLLDGEAEKLGSRFIGYYTDLPNLSFIRFEEMSFMLEKIQVLKFEFSQFIFELLPDVNKLKRQELPELQAKLDDLIAELQSNDCKLSVLRSDKLFSEREYPFDDEYAFKLPYTVMSDWIWNSIRSAKARAEKYGRLSAEVTEKKTGLLSQIFS